MAFLLLPLVAAAAADRREVFFALQLPLLLKPRLSPSFFGNLGGGRREGETPRSEEMGWIER